jgi:hypothetical protein
MPQVTFAHPDAQIGSLAIDDGIDTARWGYNLNTAVYPTFGGEVVQILSVYIDGLVLGGTVSTRSQMEAIYTYFAIYMQMATQGFNPTPDVGASAYNLKPITFAYPERGWSFEIYPQSAPGFGYSYDEVAPIWQMTAFILDDSPNIDPIKAAIADAAVAAQLTGQTVAGTTFQQLNNEISPHSGDPNANPFQTYDASAQATSGALSAAADYYNQLIPAYLSGDFSTLTGVPASGPAPASTPKNQQQGSGTKDTKGSTLSPTPPIPLPSTPTTLPTTPNPFTNPFGPITTPFSSPF